MGKRHQVNKEELPPSDRSDHVSRRYKQGKIKKAELYEQYQSAGLSPEEADEMCNLAEQDD